jgi:signal transduction histidine kinase
MLRISRELHAKNIQFDTALNNMIQGLCMLDREQRLIVCNRRYLELYGFSADVVKPGIKLREILEYSVSLGNYTEQEAARALAERPDPARLSQRVTIKQRLKDGRVIAVMNEPMPNGGSIATFQDITDIEHHEEQMRDHALKLERSNRELQDFAYVASHDLQEPLRKIEAFSDRLVRKYGATLPEDGQMYIERMQNASARMRQLINDLLAYSRITSKANPFTTANLKDILADVLSDLQIRIEETRAEVRFEELPTIEADPTQMRQLFQNIISNALKFRKKDVAPIIEIGGQVVNAPHFDEVKSTAILTIADNGIGFENQYKDQIFTIFQRLHGRLEYEGTGIGLATCRRIVERHGGEIDAEGQLGKGATFTIILPMSQSEGETQ